MMTIDTISVKQQINCRDLIERDLGQPKHRSHNYDMYRCPLHNETKGYSLAVYDDHWHCFGKCGCGGDSIAWMTEYHDLGFRDACERLSGGSLSHTVSLGQSGTKTATQKQSISLRPNATEPPPASWQKAATKVAHIAMNTLWGSEGVRAWDYLTKVRGLNEETIVNAGLGYVPGHSTEWKTIEGLKVPCGITIPWFPWRNASTIWGLKVRRAAGEPRYQQVAGGTSKVGCIWRKTSLRANRYLSPKGNLMHWSSSK